MMECAHHWVIEEANGPTSQGKCLNCKLVKEFNNSIPDDSFWVNQAGEKVSPTETRKRVGAHRTSNRRDSYA